MKVTGTTPVVFWTENRSFLLTRLQIFLENNMIGCIYLSMINCGCIVWRAAA